MKHRRAIGNIRSNVEDFMLSTHLALYVESKCGAQHCSDTSFKVSLIPGVDAGTQIRIPPPGVVSDFEQI